MNKKQITVTFSHVLHESNLPNKERREISKSINEILEPIKTDVISFGGNVEVIESKNGNFSFLCTCKNIQIKDKINELISHSMPKFKDTNNK